jgi:hypothetical protein
MWYWIAAGSLTIFFLFTILLLAAWRRLVPRIVILGAAVLFLLWLTGLIRTSIELWKPHDGVNSHCILYLSNAPMHGLNNNTLAWLEENGICKDNLFLS